MNDKFACDLYICCAGRANNKNIYAKATALYNNLVQNGINCLSNFNNFTFDEKMVETVSKSKLFLFVTDGDILTDSVGALLKNAPVYPVVNAFYKRFFNGANIGIVARDVGCGCDNHHPCVRL